MYSASAQYNTAITSDSVELAWNGSITTKGGNTYTFTKDDLSPGSGSITRTISTQSLKIGTVFASSLSVELILPGVSRYELEDAEITITNKVTGASDTIPMGVFTVSKASQALDHINISANDNMIKFEKVPFVPTANTLIQTPYAWLSDACTACGVTLGTTSAQIQIMPNGTRKTGFADVVADVKTWRDVLSYMATYLGGFAYIGRDGKLYIGHYKAAASSTVSQFLRYSSALSDYRTTYDGLYAVYKAEGVQEYVSNTNSGGLVLDIGTNPFLQFTDATNRQEALQEIIDAWDGVYYVPFSSSMGAMPIYDPGDVIQFTGNQADQYDYGVITQITYYFNDDMTITCAGDNPLLADAQDRFSKTVAGLSADYNNGAAIGGKDYWALQTQNPSALSVGSTKTQIAEIEWKQTVDIQKINFNFTCDGDLSATAMVIVLITVDDELSYQFEVSHRYMNGRIHIPVTWGERISGKGTHTAKVYMTVTDSPLLWGELA